MTYENIVKGNFISRPNRFIAYVEINGLTAECHVKNTGRCKELLVENAAVYLTENDSPKRRTRYDLIAVRKGGLLINMDSAAPNKAAAEYLRKKYGENALIKPETVYGGSRFDFYIETASEKRFVEVKGVTLEENGRALFPDAPTERGVKHLKELVRARENGCSAEIFFVIQMKGVSSFSPNDRTHPEFGAALREAAERGVDVNAADCIVTENSMTIDKKVKIIL